MKAILVALALAVGIGSLTAQASGLPDKNTSWEDLKSNHKVIFKLPQVGLENWFMSLSSVCVDGDQIRSKKMVPKCVKWKDRGRDGDRYCTEEIEKYVYTDITKTKSRCVEWGGRDDDYCRKYEEYQYTIKLDRDVPVYKRVRERREESEWERSTSYPPIFKKNYSITDCEN